MELIERLELSFKNNALSKAFCIEGVFFTYEELKQRTDKIAHKLNEISDDGNSVIGIITDNQIDTYAGILACWMLGKAYVPINPRMPINRNLEVLAQSGACAIINPSLLKQELTGSSELVSLYKGKKENYRKDSYSKGDRLMYILFTSGSTGIPKGVPISYDNLYAFTNALEQLNIPVLQEDRCLQMFDLTFDVSVASFLIPLLNGACVYTVSSDGVKYTQVYKIMRDHEITLASIVPSVINYLRPYFQEIQLPHLRCCILTAEASKVNVVKEWAPCIPNAKIYNLYGPTEATIWCTGYLWNREEMKSYNEMMAIGKPFKDIKAVVLDDNLTVVPAGHKGQLCITGPQLTPGYLNNEEKNRESFFMMDGEKYYKTGDLCFCDENGNLFYCGRLDHQIKIQGFRVELSEIEVAVRFFTGANVAAIGYKNEKGAMQIGVFIENYQGEIGSVKKQLTEKLPYYMMPAEIRSIFSFPLNTSGKIDRLALGNLLQNPVLKND